jgi:hypothetical protein
VINANMMQRRTANIAIGPSAARSILRQGAIQDLRLVFETLDLSEFTRQGVDEAIIRATDVIQQKTGCSFGAARKFLSLFLRDATHNYLLRQVYKLADVEPLLEVPLDSHVAGYLRREPEGAQLPRWVSIVGLDAQRYAEYQHVASRIAERKNVTRPDLDLFAWRQR